MILWAPTLRYSAIEVVPDSEQFSEEFAHNDRKFKLNFILINLDSSCFLWVGLDGYACNLDTLVTSFMFKDKQVSGAPILGVGSSGEDMLTAGRLSRVFKRVVHFGSCLGKDETGQLRMFAEKTLRRRACGDISVPARGLLQGIHFAV